MKAAHFPSNPIVLGKEGHKTMMMIMMMMMMMMMMMIYIYVYMCVCVCVCVCMLRKLGHPLYLFL